MRNESGLMAVVLAASLSLGIGAQQPSAGEVEVLQFQAKRNQAVMAKDLRTLEGMLADDLFYCHASGLVQTKAEFLETVRTEQFRWLTMESQGVKAHVFGDTAVVTTVGLHENITAKQRDGSVLPVELTIRTTEVYVKRGGHWQLLAFQGTRAPAVQ